LPIFILKIWFQFHTGSIKANDIVFNLYVFTCCFNSTLVRLKHNASGGYVIDHAFQFHTGSIKAGLFRLFAVAVIRFNSTLVRLKPMIAVENLSGKNVSIPHWFD